MKVTKILIAMLASAFIVTACDPIEDEDLRDKYVTDAGTPITKEALQAAISITQPFPNQDGVVEGDQYIALKNSRPDIGGSWHIEWGGEGSKQSKTLVTDNATVIMESNADYSIYYMGISANQIIKTDPVVVTVTNVFDDWSTYFTGATDKSDKSAKKTWKFREVSWGSVCNMGSWRLEIYQCRLYSRIKFCLVGQCHCRRSRRPVHGIRIRRKQDENL